MKLFFKKACMQRIPSAYMGALALWGRGAELTELSATQDITPDKRVTESITKSPSVPSTVSAVQRKRMYLDAKSISYSATQLL